MKNHRGIALLLTIAAFGLALITSNQAASAKTYTTVPTSLRGTWYHYDSNYGTYNKLKATKYHFDTKDGLTGSWYRISGAKFPSYAMGHSQLVVKRTPKNYYVVARYATDSYPYWKKVSHKGHAALRAVVPDNMETVGSTTYWYKTKKIAKHPSITYHYAKFNGYYYDHYTPTYLQVDADPQKLYTTPAGAIAKKGPSITYSNIYKKLAARWDYKYKKQDLLRIRVNSKTYYQVDNGDFQAYNTWRDGKSMTSPYAPSTNSKIVIRRGDKLAKANTWDQCRPTKTSILIVNSWHKQNSAWVKTK